VSCILVADVQCVAGFTSVATLNNVAVGARWKVNTVCYDHKTQSFEESTMLRSVPSDTQFPLARFCLGQQQSASPVSVLASITVNGNSVTVYRNTYLANTCEGDASASTSVSFSDTEFEVYDDNAGSYCRIYAKRLS
jgi:hypothetical protein